MGDLNGPALSSKDVPSNVLEVSFANPHMDCDSNAIIEHCMPSVYDIDSLDLISVDNRQQAQDTRQ